MSGCNHDCSNCSQADCASREIKKLTPNENSNIKRIFAVISGKGGVGKSLVTSLLAAKMNKNGKIARLVRRVSGALFPIENETAQERTEVRLPLPLVICLCTIGLSLLMIVGSSAMLNNAYRETMTLKSDLDMLSAEQKEMQLDLDDRLDLLSIRNVAVNEYGMINEEYVSARYLDIRSENTVESYRLDGGADTTASVR